MSWKLRTETDLSTGRAFRTFICIDEDGQMTAAVDEGDGLELVKELMRTYPEAIQAIANELTGDTQQVPQPTQPPQQEAYEPLYAEDEDEMPLQPIPQAPMIKGRIRRPEQEHDVEDTPLRIPSREAVTLQSLAPKIDRDVPQG
jgi:hypothetical protein